MKLYTAEITGGPDTGLFIGKGDFAHKKPQYYKRNGLGQIKWKIENRQNNRGKNVEITECKLVKTREIKLSDIGGR